VRERPPGGSTTPRRQPERWFRHHRPAEPRAAATDRPAKARNAVLCCATLHPMSQNQIDSAKENIGF